MQPKNRRLAALSRHISPASNTGRQPAADEVDALFRRFFADETAPGVAYGIVVDGRLVHSGGYGTLEAGHTSPPAADSIFRIASMTKSFVAAAVLLLRDEGVLQLCDPVDRWIPELRGVPLASADSPPPTVRHLLSMNSGLSEDDPWADRLEEMSDEAFLALVGEPKSYARPSGVAYEYSNLGYAMLGRVIQNATGSPSAVAALEWVRRRIIEPLGMKDTAWSSAGLDRSRLAYGYARVDGRWEAQPVQQPGSFSALGGLYSTVADLSIWVGGFLDAWPARDIAHSMA